MFPYPILIVTSHSSRRVHVTRVQVKVNNDTSRLHRTVELENCQRDYEKELGTYTYH